MISLAWLARNQLTVLRDQRYDEPFYCILLLISDCDTHVGAVVDLGWVDFGKAEELVDVY